MFQCRSNERTRLTNARDCSTFIQSIEAISKKWMCVFLVFIERSTVREAERAAQSAAGSSGNRRVEVVVVLLLAEHGEVRVVGHRHGVAGFRAPPKLRLREEEAHPFLSEMLRYAFCGILRPEICRKVCVFVLSLQCLKIAVHRERTVHKLYEDTRTAS